MTRRIALWALIGFAIACGWAIIALAIGPKAGLWDQRALWTVAEITCPVAVIGKFVALKFYVVVAINAATYAGIGFAVELLRLTFAPAKTS
jgi:hypothetical protein